MWRGKPRAGLPAQSLREADRVADAMAELSAVDPDELSYADLLAGEADDATRARLEDRRRTDPDFFDATEAARRAWNALPTMEQLPVDPRQVQESWLRFRSLANMPPLAGEARPQAPVHDLPVRRAWLDARRTRFLRVAATWVALMVIPVAGIWMWNAGAPVPESSVRQVGSPSTSPVGTPVVSGAVAQVTTTGDGERRTLTLADGSVVLLEPNSRLSQALGTSREFSLAGAATFTVQHASGATFRVRSDVAVVTVTGTVFRVDASTAGVTAVTVSEGRVLLAGTDAAAPAVALSAGERGRVREGEGPVREPR